MKKIFVLLAIAATLSAVSCNKNNAGGKKPKDKEEKEYVAPIKVDGDFSDWAKLDATKVATATCDPDATKTALKLVKVYADEVFVFIYFEWDKEEVPHYAPTNPADENTGAYAPFHIYMNGDGSTATGGFAGQWSDAATDVHQRHLRRCRRRRQIRDLHCPRALSDWQTGRHLLPWH